MLETVEVVGNSLKCNERKIDLDDIVAILPNLPQPGYIVLFLERAQGDESSTRLLKTNISSLPSEAALSQLLTEFPIHLRLEKPVDVVISTRSGTGTAMTVFENLLQPLFTYLDIDYRIHETQSDQTIVELSQTQFLERACAGISQNIVLLSGDGGLIDIVDVFYKSTQHLLVSPHIFLIPCGTGNAMASSIGLRSPASGLTAIFRGQPTSVPIFATKLSLGSQMVADEGRQRTPIDLTPDSSHRIIYGAVVASWGMHAALVADSDTAEYRKFGSERFQLAAKELLYPSDGAEPHRFQGRITLTGAHREVIEDEHMYVLATLVPRLEKDFLISPASEPLGGSLRLVHFGPLPADEAMRLMALAYQGGQHVLDKLVTYVEFEKMRIDFQEGQERWRRVCIDGRIVAIEEGGWIEICKEPRQLLNVIKP
ncbi:ATP-NAD kinase PpnK-type [Penicillium taxi]|uniref:ATP-NAD kinase PpnK-type n=1 Tax=Penicillium taxi TaxID=168475 RepID=UPI002544D3A5|nr:ATP-NAD kinase PpnK-type [Penicillium taxi]KAJ5885333.1 ATP-NAD kinase PpnK-type [Penicillium taxi]